MNMMFRDIPFLHQPSAFEIITGADCRVTPMLGSRALAEHVTLQPRKVTGKGTVHGEEGVRWCERLAVLSGDEASGWLFTPLAAPMKAFLTSFSYRKSSQSDAVSYSFTFTEDCDSRALSAAVECTTVQAGETAFDVAHRCRMSVDELEALNDYVSPFGLTEGEQVRIR